MKKYALSLLALCGLWTFGPWTLDAAEPLIGPETSYTRSLKAQTTAANWRALLGVAAGTNGAAVNLTISGAIMSAVTNSDFTASRVLVSGAGGIMTNATATTTEVNFLSGVTGGLQTNINARVAITNGTARALALLGAATAEQLTISGSLIAQGSGLHAIGGTTESDSHVVISGNFGQGNIGDNRALGIITTLYPDPTGGGRSTEGINNRMSITLPASGNIATIEGYHIDFSGAWGPHSEFGLWEPTAATVGSVIGYRVRGNLAIPSGASYVVGLQLDGNLTGGSVANYNIWSQYATSVNRFDGIVNVYGLQGHNIGSDPGGGFQGGPTSSVGLYVGPTVTGNGGVYGTTGTYLGGTVSPAATRNGIGVRVSPGIVEAASGAHLDFASMLIDAPNITAGAASVDNATTLKIVGAPSVGTVINRSLWVTAGATYLGSSMETGGSGTFGDNVLLQKTAASGLGVTVYNTSSASGAHASVALSASGASGGNPFIAFNTAAVGNQWNLGMDNSDSDQFKLSYGGASVGSGDLFAVTTGGNIGIKTKNAGYSLDLNSATGLNLRLIYDDADGSPATYVALSPTSGGNLQVTPTGGSLLLEQTIAGVMALSVYNTSSGASATAQLNLTVAAGTSADPFINFGIASVGPGWAMGLDNSDADTFKLSYGSGNVGSGTKFSVGTDGATIINGSFQLNGALTTTGATSLGDSLLLQKTAASGLGITIYNTANSGSAHAMLALSAGGSSGGDSVISFNEASAGNQWNLGMDNSDSDKFKLSYGGATVGSGDIFSFTTAGVASFVGDLVLSTAGKGIQVKEGSNARMGNSTLVGGAVTVSNTSVTANTRIFLSRATTGGTTGDLSYTKSAATSFTINSSSGTDTSTVDWFLVEPAP